MTSLALALLVAVPVVLGAAAAAPGRRLGHLLAALATAAVAAGALAARPGVALTIASTPLSLPQIARLELVFIAALSLCLLAYHYLAGRDSPLPVLLPPVLAAIAAGRLFGGQLLVAASFLQLAALLVSLLMIAEQPDWQASVAGASYLILSALGGTALLFAFVLANLQRLNPGGQVTVAAVVAVLCVGLALQWGVAPLHFWLPSVVERTGPAAASLAVGVLGPATLGLLLQALAAQPQLVSDERTTSFLTYGGLFTATFGAAAALAPAKLRRTLGYVLVADMGFILLGIAWYTRIGTAAAVVHLAHRCLVALVLICAAAELERDDRGVAECAAPYMWTVLLVGSVTLLGVPPLSGFAADWAVYQALSLMDWRLALLLALSSVVCLAAVLATLGRLHRHYPRPWRRPRPAELWLMALAVVAGLWGLAPSPVVGVVYQAVSSLPFLRPF